MYWLICSLIILMMMGVLAVANGVTVPADLSWLSMLDTLGLSLLLSMLAIILLTVSQFVTAPSLFRLTSQPTSHQAISKTKSSFRAYHYLLLFLLATVLIIGSGLQALVTHQQAEATQVTDAVRVEALVRIEGLSDSVYDEQAEAGYRQVAVITQVTPLITQQNAQDLTEKTERYFNNLKNSLSEKYQNNVYPDSSIIDDHVAQNKDTHAEYRILLNAYPNRGSNETGFSTLNQLQPGDMLFMSLALTPLATAEQVTSNPTGFDSYRWLRGRHIDGMANVLAISETSAGFEASSVSLTPSTLSSGSYLQRLRTHIDRGRWQLRQHFYKDWSTQTTAVQQAKAVTLSLLTGDRSLINRDTKALYQLAGISHLLAISGTHVLFLAIVLAGIAVLGFDRFYPVIYRYVARWQIRWLVMIGAAFIYALFTGFDVPAARTAWMLLAIGLVRISLLPIGSIRVLLALAVVMAWFDPYVLWQAGYWLSFVAVALLLKYDHASYQSNSTELASSPKNPPIHRTRSTVLAYISQAGSRIMRLQFWLFLTLLPVTLLLFGKASLWGLIINLFAIGLFGWVIVPLNLLAGLFYLLSPAIADSIWILVSHIVGALHSVILWLTSQPALSETWLYTPVNMAIIIMALLSILPWLLPKGLLSRWLTLPPLTLLMMTVYTNQQSLVTVPTLYILPTGDSYITAALLQYPTVSEESTNWLFLADHRPASTRTMPSSLTADKLATSLEQQLGSLSIDKLESIVVQSSSIGLADTFVSDKQRVATDTKNAELLPMTVAQLNEHLFVSQYWQAGRSDRWSAFQQAYQTIRQSKETSNISAQRCEQGKIWQSANDELSVQAITGWSRIEDSSVWDCTIAIETDLPIRVLRYNAADPLNSLPVSSQAQIATSQLTSKQSGSSQSRLILNTDTHQRVWQLWSLLCDAQMLDASIVGQSTWLGFSTSHITADVLGHQKVENIMTYDDQPLAAALSLKKLSLEAMSIEGMSIEGMSIEASLGTLHSSPSPDQAP